MYQIYTFVETRSPYYKLVRQCKSEQEACTMAKRLYQFQPTPHKAMIITHVFCAPDKLTYKRGQEYFLHYLFNGRLD
jgi:hypothetical protein